MLTGITAAILAGGLGTRLRSVVPDRPKVLAEVHGRPFLSYLLDRLGTAGIRRVVLLTGHRARQVRDTFGDTYNGINLAYSEEPAPLGTAGAIRHALPLLTSDPVLVLNGDSFCDADLSLFFFWHSAQDRRGSLLLADVEDAARFGRVAIGEDERIVHFEEKDGRAEPGLINAGVYILSRGLIESIPVGTPTSVEREIFPSWISDGLHGYRVRGRFIDIGTPESYAAAEAFFRAPQP